MHPVSFMTSVPKSPAAISDLKYGREHFPYANFGSKSIKKISLTRRMNAVSISELDEEFILDIEFKDKEASFKKL